MRKNTARHWLHAALDLLPVILIPVFMIYSHRHVMTERTEVDIQYKYQSNEVNTANDLVVGNLYTILGEDIFNLYLTDEYNFTLRVVKYDSILISATDLSLDEHIFDSYYNEVDTIFTIQYLTNTLYLSFINNDDVIIFVDTDFDYYFTNLYFIITDGLDDFQSYCVHEGVPLPQYTDYNVIESVDVQDTNSSIMNVFMDDFNYSVNKYFNMGNVFNLKDVYHWFEVNIFNNNPPLVMASIYNIIVYEFVMDLLFLLYGLFMWFVDMLKRLIEKPIDSIK